MSRTLVWLTTTAGLLGLALAGWWLTGPGPAGGPRATVRLSPDPVLAPAGPASLAAPREDDVHPLDTSGPLALPPPDDDAHASGPHADGFTGIVGTVLAGARAAGRARVTAAWPGHLRSVWTDRHGRFVLGHVPPGEVTLSAQAGPASPVVRREVDVQPERVSRVEVVLGHHQICGRIHAPDDTSLAGLSVWLFDEVHRRVAHALTDDAGVFRFEHLEPGTFRARVNGWRQEARHAPVVRPTWSAPAHVGHGGGVPEVDVHVDPGETLRATVLDPGGGPAEPGTEVWLVRIEGGAVLLGQELVLGADDRLQTRPRPYERVARSDRDGAVAFRGLAPGEYALLAEPASPDELRAAGVRVRVEPGDEVPPVTLTAAAR